MTLEEIRKEIDKIDSRLLPLFIARMHCAEQVAKVKAEQKLPVLNTKREEEILESIGERAGDYGGEARVLYSTIMDISRALQHKLLGGGSELRELVESAPLCRKTAGKNIACPGVPGSYSHEAAAQLFPNRDTQFYTTFHDVFKAVENGSADYGVVPVENSSAGSVGEVYDYILGYRFYIVGAATLHIHHCLAAAPGVKTQDIRSVCSHPQALAQCSDRIAKEDWEPVQHTNTAAAAKMASESKSASMAAICSATAAKEYGLNILEENIQNSSTNCTRFIVISRELFIPDNAQKISLCFALPHKTGSLSSVLARFAMSGLNLTKIESRPIAERNFEYDFYLDFSGNVRDAKTLDVLCALYSELPRFSFLGNYVEQD